MSSRNDEASAYGIVIAILAYVAMFVFAAVVFYALLLSIVALLAWFKPLKIGSLTIEPEEARAFIGRGLAGAALLPLFVAFSGWFLGLELSYDGLHYLVAGGYAYGSVGIEWLTDDEDEQPAAPPSLPQASVKPPLKAPVKAPPQKQLSGPNVVPFKFADWDDEGKRK
jgi:hypothetical protein